MAPHILVRCTSCSSPIVLPTQTLERPFTIPEEQPNESFAVGIACSNCKSVRRYFLQLKHPENDALDWAPEAEEQNEDTVLINTLGCEAEDCRSLLPLFANWSSAASHAERLADMQSWRWEDLRCPEGHLIPKPRPILESATTKGRAPLP
jgi:hypothetical protein